MGKFLAILVAVWCCLVAFILAVVLGPHTMELTSMCDLPVPVWEYTNVSDISNYFYSERYYIRMTDAEYERECSRYE